MTQNETEAVSVKPRLSTKMVGITAKIAAGLCTWEQGASGFVEPVGSCEEKASHGLTCFEGQRDMEFCQYHANCCATPGGNWPYKPYPLSP